MSNEMIKATKSSQPVKNTKKTLRGKKEPAFFPPFRVGDVVRIARIPKNDGYDTYDAHDRKRFRKDIGEEHIIASVDIDGINDYRYSTDRSAWHVHYIFDLVRECDEKSIADLLESIRIEAESEEEEDQDEEDL